MIICYEEMDRIKSKWSTSKWSIIKTFIRFLILILISINSCRSITIDELYPFGESVDESLNKEADTFVEINLSIPIAYYQNLFPSIFVNDNGLVSFLKEIPIFYNAQFPLQYPFIAVMYSNVDIRNRGSVYYRETKESSLLDRSTNDVQRYFNDGKNFRTQSLFITTWDNVGRFEKLSDLVSRKKIKKFKFEMSYAIYFSFPKKKSKGKYCSIGNSI